MKKFISLLLTAALMLSLAACGTNNTENTSSDTDQENSERVPFSGEYVVDAAYVKEHMGDDSVLLVDAACPHCSFNWRTCPDYAVDRHAGLACDGRSVQTGRTADRIAGKRIIAKSKL